MGFWETLAKYNPYKSFTSYQGIEEGPGTWRAPLQPPDVVAEYGENLAQDIEEFGIPDNVTPLRTPGGGRKLHDLTPDQAYVESVIRDTAAGATRFGSGNLSPVGALFALTPFAAGRYATNLAATKVPEIAAGLAKKLERIKNIESLSGAAFGAEGVGNFAAEYPEIYKDITEGRYRQAAERGAPHLLQAAFGLFGLPGQRKEVARLRDTRELANLETALRDADLEAAPKMTGEVLSPDQISPTISRNQPKRESRMFREPEEGGIVPEVETPIETTRVSLPVKDNVIDAGIPRQFKTDTPEGRAQLEEVLGPGDETVYPEPEHPMPRLEDSNEAWALWRWEEEQRKAAQQKEIDEAPWPPEGWKESEPTVEIPEIPPGQTIGNVPGGRIPRGPGKTPTVEIPKPKSEFEIDVIPESEARQMPEFDEAFRVGGEQKIPGKGRKGKQTPEQKAQVEDLRNQIRALTAGKQPAQLTSEEVKQVMALSETVQNLGGFNANEKMGFENFKKQTAGKSKTPALDAARIEAEEKTRQTNEQLEKLKKGEEVTALPWQEPLIEEQRKQKDAKLEAEVKEIRARIAEANKNKVQIKLTKEEIGKLGEQSGIEANREKEAKEVKKRIKKELAPLEKQAKDRQADLDRFVATHGDPENYNDTTTEVYMSISEEAENARRVADYWRRRKEADPSVTVGEEIPPPMSPPKGKDLSPEEAMRRFEETKAYEAQLEAKRKAAEKKEPAEKKQAWEMSDEEFEAAKGKIREQVNRRNALLGEQAQNYADLQEKFREAYSTNNHVEQKRINKKIEAIEKKLTPEERKSLAELDDDIQELKEGAEGRFRDQNYTNITDEVFGDRAEEYRRLTKELDNPDTPEDQVTLIGERLNDMERGLSPEDLKRLDNAGDIPDNIIDQPTPPKPPSNNGRIIELKRLEKEVLDNPGEFDNPGRRLQGIREQIKKLEGPTVSDEIAALEREKSIIMRGRRAIDLGYDDGNKVLNINKKIKELGGDPNAPLAASAPSKETPKKAESPVQEALKAKEPTIEIPTEEKIKRVDLERKINELRKRASGLTKGRTYDRLKPDELIRLRNINEQRKALEIKLAKLNEVKPPLTEEQRKGRGRPKKEETPQLALDRHWISKNIRRLKKLEDDFINNPEAASGLPEGVTADDVAKKFRDSIERLERKLKETPEYQAIHGKPAPPEPKPMEIPKPERGEADLARAVLDENPISKQLEEAYRESEALAPQPGEFTPERDVQRSIIEDRIAELERQQRDLPEYKDWISEETKVAEPKVEAPTEPTVTIPEKPKIQWKLPEPEEKGLRVPEPLKTKDKIAKAKEEAKKTGKPTPVKDKPAPGTPQNEEKPLIVDPALPKQAPLLDPKLVEQLKGLPTDRLNALKDSTDIDVIDTKPGGPDYIRLIRRQMAINAELARRNALPPDPNKPIREPINPQAAARLEEANRRDGPGGDDLNFLEEDTPQERDPVRYVSRWARFFRKSITVLEKASPRRAAAAKAYLRDMSGRASQLIGRRRQLTADFTKAEQAQVVNLLKGRIRPNNTMRPEVVTAFQEIRQMLDWVQAEAARLHVSTGHLQNYYPRIADKSTAQWANQPVDMSPWFSFKQPNIERHRVGRRGRFRNDLFVLDDYFLDVSRRLAEVQHFGKDLEKVLTVTGRQAENHEAAQTVMKYFNRLTGRVEHGGIVETAGGKAMYLEALADLGLSAPLQFGQVAHTASYGGVRRSLWNFAKLIGNYPKIVAPKLFGTSQHEINALKSSALWPSLTHEAEQAYGATGSRVGFLYGVPTADKAMRIHANMVGYSLLESAFANPRSFLGRWSKNAAVKDIKRLGLDITQLQSMPREQAKQIVGATLSNKTNFNTGYLDLPHWASTPGGRLVWQFHKFAYKQGEYAWGVTKLAAKGDVKPLLRYAVAVAPFAGEAIADFRAWIKGESILSGEEIDDWDDQTFVEKAITSFANKRVPITSPGWRYVQNVATSGGIGYIQDAIRDVNKREFPQSSAGGAVFSTGVSWLEGLWKTKTRFVEEEDKPLNPLGRALVRKAPVPYSYKLPDIVLPEEESAPRAPRLFPSSPRQPKQVQ